jgi:hypothetical protein
MRIFVVLVLLLARSLALAQSGLKLPDPLKTAAELGGAVGVSALGIAIP